MRRRTVPSLLAVLGACAVVTGCTGGSGVTTQTVDPTTSSSASSMLMSASPSSAATVNPDPTTPVTSGPNSSTVGTSEGISPQEASDRAAAQAQWTQFWQTYIEIVRTPAAERAALVSAVAVEPAASSVLADAEKLEGQGRDTYGTVTHHFSWPKPIDSQSTALLTDCQDQSAYGAIETATGFKKTVGVAKDHLQGSLLRGEDGVWRVQQVFYLADEPC